MSEVKLPTGGLVELRNVVTDTLIAAITDLGHVVRVHAGTSLPSTRCACQLYGSWRRARRLVARNDVATPAMMPSTFEAVL